MPIPLPIPAMPWLMNRLGSDPDSALCCVPRMLFRAHLGHSQRINQALVATGKVYHRDRYRHRQTLPFRPSSGALTADELAWLGLAVAAVGGLVLVGD